VTDRVLTLRELNRALLARQLLLERARLTLVRAIERIAGLQAQHSPSPYIGLWSRLEGFRIAALERSLARGQTVKATLMRTTLHIVSRADYWGTVLTRAQLVHAPPSGTFGYRGSPAFVPAASWLGFFGTASVDDVSSWSGLRSPLVRQGLDALELRRFCDERGRLLLDLPRAPLPAADTAVPAASCRSGTRARKKLTLEPCEPLPKRVLTEVQREGEQAVEFLGGRSP